MVFIAVIVILLLIIGVGLKTADDSGGKQDKIRDIEKIKESSDKYQEIEKDRSTGDSVENNQKEEITANKNANDSLKDNQSGSQNTSEVIYNSSMEDKENEENAKPSKTEKEYIKISDGKITCDLFGRYSGQYVEDGRDELVNSVATILVTNQSDEYLEYATLTFDIEGNPANFIVTGLPAGTSAWVMEAGKLEIEAGSNFSYQECLSEFRDDVTIATDKVSLTADGNLLTATNKSNEEMKNVIVYYRVLHEDGNYLGGVTYTAQMGDLKSGDSSKVLAGHYSAKDCEIVRVSWNEDGQSL